jgi:hypothetical protein
MLGKMFCAVELGRMLLIGNSMTYTWVRVKLRGYTVWFPPSSRLSSGLAYTYGPGSSIGGCV